MAAEENTPERWLPVVGFEGYYEVSELGRVRSLDRVVRSRYRSNWKMTGRIIRPSRDGGGYLGVNLSANGRKCRGVIHRLVLAAFVGPIPDGHEVDHWDFDRANNRLSNLRYATSEKNRRRIDDNGRRPKGENHNSSFLTAVQVREIRLRCANGERQRSVAQSFGISQGHVGLIVSRRRWAHLA